MGESHELLHADTEEIAMTVNSGSEVRKSKPGGPEFDDTHDGADPYQEMVDLILGYWATQTVRAIADLSLADHLADGGLTAAEVAGRESVPVDSAFRLLRAGVGLGLMTVDTDGRFYATQRLAPLRKDALRSLRSIALSFTDPELWQRWNGFVASIRNGPSQNNVAAESEMYTDLAQNAEKGKRFSAAMASATTCWSYNIADVVDTTHVQRVIDIGGANGTLVTLLQQANPELRAVIFDRPAVASWARSEIARSGFADRTDVVGGDFFASVPSGDLYLLKFILHNWDDQQCVDILQHCREAAFPGARIAIIEFVLGDLPDPGRLATLDDMAMLAVLGGRSRSLDEFDRLLIAAGFRRTAVRSTTFPQCVIEAIVV
jgi:hypothetical protein